MGTTLALMGSNWDSAYRESLDESPEMPTATGMKTGLPGRILATGLCGLDGVRARATGR